MCITNGRVQFNSPTTQLDISEEDFETMLEMCELITNNYYTSDFCFSDANGKYTVGCIKDQIEAVTINSYSYSTTISETKKES